MLCELFPGYPVHWVVDQAEYATDLLFKSRRHLALLYRALLDHAVRTHSKEHPELSLATKWDRQLDGEVHTYEDDRWFGASDQAPHEVNWLKM